MAFKEYVERIIKEKYNTTYTVENGTIIKLHYVQENGDITNYATSPKGFYKDWDFINLNGQEYFVGPSTCYRDIWHQQLIKTQPKKPSIWKRILRAIYE